MNGFIFQNTGRFEEILVNGAGTFVMQVSLRDFNAMELALQHITHHNFYLPTFK